MGYDRYPRNDDLSRDNRYRSDNRPLSSDDWSDRDRGSYGANSSGYGYGNSGSRDFDRSDRDNYGRGGQYYGDRSGGYGQRDDRPRGGQDDRYRGSYASDGHRFAEQRDGNRDRQRGNSNADRLDYDTDDRGFLARAGDEVRSWFGDEDAERRRERDQRYDEQMARYDDRHSDHAYRAWRDTQVSAFDRDYDEYRQENASKFQNEFSAFRTERQGQRDSLTRVAEHMEVLGKDGEHVGTVDKVRGDRIILTKNDVDAGGHHHSIPSRWVESVDDKVKLRKTASEAKTAWRDEEQQQAMFGDRTQQRQYGSDRYGSTGNDRNSDTGRDHRQYGATATSGSTASAGTVTGASQDGTGGTNLNRSFSGTY